MTTPLRTSEGKWVIFERATGKRFERWPVDAREQTASGDYSYDPPDGHIEPEAESPSASPSEVETAKHPLGIPLVATKSGDAAPSAPVQIPGARSSGKARNLAGA